MAGISSKAAGKLSNKRKYSGNEIQQGEFSDGAGLELYDFEWRQYDPQVGRFNQIDPFATDYASYTPYNYCLNSPVNAIDPSGTSAEYTIDEKNKTITITSNIYFYGGSANAKNANDIASSIQNQWNDAGASISITDADGNSVDYAVSFKVTGTAVTESEISQLKDEGKFTNADNFVRLEEKGDTKWAQGSNVGFMSMEDFNKSKTTAAHEFGHGLGWVDQDQVGNKYSSNGMHDMQGNVANGLRSPGIMTPRETKAWQM